MLTLNQIIAQIQALATAHAQVASSGVGTLAEWQANPDRVYPLIWLFHERTDVTDSAIIHRIRLIAADRVKVGESGEDNIGHEQEVLSDMLSVLLDFVAYFAQQHGQSYIVERSGSIEPFTERGNDRVAGVSYVLNVRQPIDFSKCQIPQSGATIPPSVDGLTLYDFCDPAVIARLTPSQVACLEAEFGVTCDPVTLTINGTSAGSEPSGGEFNIKVSLDGNPAGSWDGVDTWEVTSPPCPTPSLTVSPSSATPTFGASVTLTATPTNITPSSFVWYANGNQIGTGSSLVWTVNIAGAINIRCVATDGTLTAQGTTSITSTVVRASSIYMDGVNDRIMGYWVNKDTPNTGLAFSFRIKPTSAGKKTACAFGTTFNATYYSVYIYASNTQLEVELWNDAVAFSFVVVPITTAWNHVNLWLMPSNSGQPSAYSCLWVNGVFRQETLAFANYLRFSPRISMYAHKVADMAIFKTSLVGTASANLGALTKADADQLYNGGNLQAIPGTNTGNLTRIAWWPCIEAPKAPLTVFDSIIDVDNGALLQPGSNFASPFGLINDIPS